MSKEITLEELAASSPKQPTATPDAAAKKPESATTATRRVFKPGTTISAEDLGAHLRETNGVPAPQQIVGEDTPMVKDAFAAMDRTIAERKKRIDEELMPIVESNAMDMAMGEAPTGEEAVEVAPGDKVNTPAIAVNNNPMDTSDLLIEDDGDDEAVEVAPSNPAIANLHRVPAPVSTTPVKKSEPADDNDNDELDSLMKELDTASADIVDDEEETPEELRARFKDSLASVGITRDPVDLTKFKIRKNAVSSAAVLAAAGNSPRSLKSADWVLFHTGRSMTFNECSGPELDNLRKTINNSNGVNGVIASLRFIYNHVVDANKPTFEAWCKLIRTEDIESLYFGIYRACYADSNLVARYCGGDNGCKKTSLINTNIDDMVKYADDETRAKFQTIFGQDSTTGSTAFTSEMIQVSDDFAVSFSSPSLYSTFIQYATLKPEITDKYSDTLNTMAYIDGFYKIDREAGELIPIAIKEYPNNLNKTVISKLKVYTDILKTLTNDQYNYLTAKLSNIIQESKVTYVYPEATCPECGCTIASEDIDSMLNLLFTRAQLIQVKAL